MCVRAYIYVCEGSDPSGLYVCAYVRVCVCVYVCAYVWVCVCAYVSVRVCASVYVCV